MKPKVTVLLSGGIDSAACVAFFLKESFPVEAIHVNYAQAAAKYEAEAAKAITAFYKIPLAYLTLSGNRPKGTGLIQGRNAFLLFAALMELPNDSSIVALGIHAGTNYADCSPSFVEKMQSLFDYYSNGRIQISVPFLDWNKFDIFNFCKEINVPLELTYSCESGLPQPCGSCLTCRDLQAIYACS